MSLIAAYGFSEGQGTTIADLSGNGHSLALNNAFWTTGHTGNGILNNAQTQGATGTVPAITTTVTLMCWMKPISLATGGTNFACGIIQSNGNTDLGLFAQRGSFGTSNVLQADVRINGNLTAANGTALTVGSWTHAAVTFDGTNIRLYRDGSLITTVTNTGSISLTTTFYVAGALPVAGFDTNIAVDDVRLYNEVLDATAITTQMNTPVAELIPTPRRFNGSSWVPVGQQKYYNGTSWINSGGARRIS